MIAPELGIKMVDTFLATAHTEGLESWRAEFLKDAFAQVQTIDVQLHGIHSGRAGGGGSHGRMRDLPDRFPDNHAYDEIIHCHSVNHDVSEQLE